MTTVGFLHTADVHVATFTRLLKDADSNAAGLHVVDESLLASARAGGIDDELRARITTRLDGLAGQVDVILCTCSTISGVAESLGTSAGVPVVRLDRPMARRAVRAGARIGVVAAVESTIGSTFELLEEEAAAQHAVVELVARPCLGAWVHFERGDIDAYLAELARHIDAIAADVDAIVLAQASMAPAAGLATTSTPVLTSPELAVAEALGVAHRP